MPRELKRVASRKAFEAGKADAWSTGDYGHRVRVKCTPAGSLKMFWQDPATGRTRQSRLFAVDSRELRQQATKVAVALSENLRAGLVGEAAAPKPPKLEELRVFDVCLLYMQRVPGWTEEMMDWSATQIEKWYPTLPEQVRAASATPTAATLTKDIRSFQHLWKSREFARDRLALEIEPGDATKLSGREVAAGRSPRTVSNELDRLSCAFRYVVTQHRKSVGLLFNPIDGRRVDRTKARIPRYTEEEQAALLKAAGASLEEGESWRLWAILAIAHSGRRIEAMLHLTLADHDFAAGTVTWRAEWAKAENYGRGDAVLRMTRLHRRAVEWLSEHHPNPRGPEYPLIWDPESPDRPIRYDSMLTAWHRMEKKAGVPYIRGRAFHSMRRAVVTLLSARLGVEAAADFVGMTPKTANEFNYRQTLSESMEEAAKVIDASAEEYR